MYIYAREGVEIERQPREAIIHDISVEALQGNELRIRVKCGKGTYIRTLAEDIGRSLGCGGAYLTFLRRSILDGFDLSQAYTLDELETTPMQERDSRLLPADILMRNFPAATLEPPAAMSLLQGRTISDYVSENRLEEGQKIRLYNQANRFLGLGEMMASGEIAPKRLIAE
jgi:tRNA pseudouridine55 synthase